MDKINIDNFFSPKNNTQNNHQKVNISYNNYNPISISTLYNNTNKNNHNNKPIINMEKIKYAEKNRKKIIFEQYEKLYNSCITKINYANDLHKDNLIFEIPLANWNLSDYNPIECLNFIEYELKKINFETLILNNNSIYISWKNLRIK